MASGLARCWQSAGCRALCSSSPTLWMHSTVLFISPALPHVAEHFCHSPTHHLQRGNWERGKRKEKRGKISARASGHAAGSIPLLVTWGHGERRIPNVSVQGLGAQTEGQRWDSPRAVPGLCAQRQRGGSCQDGSSREAQPADGQCQGCCHGPTQPGTHPQSEGEGRSRVGSHLAGQGSSLQVRCWSSGRVSASQNRSSTRPASLSTQCTTCRCTPAGGMDTEGTLRAPTGH